MAALRCFDDPEGDAREIEQARADIVRLRGLLSRADLDRGIRVKACWSLEGVLRWLRNAERAT